MSRPAKGGASYRAVLALPHARSLIAAALPTRLAYGLLSLPLLLALQHSTGSYAAAGTATGLFGLAAAVFGPLRARWVERRPATLPVLALCYALLLTAVAAGSTTRMGSVPAAVLTALTGAFAPPVGPPVRTAWGRLAADEALRRRALTLDTAAESAVFAAGPMAGSALIALLSAPAALGLSAALALAGSSALAAVLRMPGAAPAAAGTAPSARRPAGPLRAPGFAVLLLVLLGTGCALSMAEIAVVAAWGAGAAGPLLALVPIGGIAGGLAYGRRQWAAPPGQRLLVLAALCAASLALPAVVYSTSGAGAGLLLAGACTDALVVTAYLLVEALVGEGARTEAGAWVNTAYNLGVSFGSGTAGLLIDRARPQAALATAAVVLGAFAALASLRPSLARRSSVRPSLPRPRRKGGRGACTFAGRLRTVHGSLMTEVRTMDLADIDAVSALRVSGWQSAYAGIIPQSYLDAMSIEEDAAQRRQWFTAAGNKVRNLVATEDAVVTGWAAIGPRTGDPSGRAAELHALYVRPDRIGTGTGRLLLEAARCWAVAHGYRRLELWVLAGNVRAQRFYARAGFAPDGAERVEEYDGVPLKDLHYVGDARIPR